MVDQADIPSPVFTSPLVLENEQKLAFGGLRVYVYYVEDGGVSTRVFGPVDGDWAELLRFDDFPGDPHFHAPFPGPATKHDPANGEPHVWFLGQVRDHLPEWLRKTDRERVLDDLDLEEIARNVDQIDAAMLAAAPKDYVRVTGVGLQKAS